MMMPKKKKNDAASSDASEMSMVKPSGRRLGSSSDITCSDGIGTTGEAAIAAGA